MSSVYNSRNDIYANRNPNYSMKKPVIVVQTSHIPVKVIIKYHVHIYTEYKLRFKPIAVLTHVKDERNHDRYESQFKHKPFKAFQSLSKPSRLGLKVLIILTRARRRSIRTLFLQLSKLLIYLLYPVGLILKIPKTFQIAISILDRRRYIRNDLSGLLIERRRHDCKSFSPDLFSRSCIYIYIYVCTQPARS